MLDIFTRDEILRAKNLSIKEIEELIIKPKIADLESKYINCFPCPITFDSLYLSYCIKEIYVRLNRNLLDQ